MYFKVLGLRYCSSRMFATCDLWELYALLIFSPIMYESCHLLANLKMEKPV